MAESSCPSYCLCFWLEFYITWLFYSLYFVLDPLFDHVFYRCLLSIQVYQTLCEQQRYACCVSRGLLLNKVLHVSPGLSLSSCQVLVDEARRRQWQPTPVLLPGKSQGWRRLVGCSPWGHEESDTYWATSLSLFTFMYWRRKWQPTPVFLPGESQGRRSLVGCHLWGRAESDTTEAT